VKRRTLRRRARPRGVLPILPEDAKAPKGARGLGENDMVVIPAAMVNTMCSTLEIDRWSFPSPREMTTGALQVRQKGGERGANCQSRKQISDCRRPLLWHF
jgi:hypothetical protein